MVNSTWFYGPGTTTFAHKVLILTTFVGNWGSIREGLDKCLDYVVNPSMTIPPALQVVAFIRHGHEIPLLRSVVMSDHFSCHLDSKTQINKIKITQTRRGI